MLREAREEAHNIISEAKEVADSTIREYNKLKKQNKNPNDNKRSSWPHDKTRRPDGL